MNAPDQVALADQQQPSADPAAVKALGDQIADVLRSPMPAGKTKKKVRREVQAMWDNGDGTQSPITIVENAKPKTVRAPVVRPYPDAKLHARWKREQRKSAIEDLKNLSMRILVAIDQAQDVEDNGPGLLAAEDFGYLMKIQLEDFGTRLEKALQALGLPHAYNFTDDPEDARPRTTSPRRPRAFTQRTSRSTV